MSEPGPSNIYTFSSPKKKRSKRTVMHSVDKETLINIYKHVEETWPKDSYPYKYDIADKTAEIMGISRSSVFKTIRERKEKGRVESPTPRSQRRSIIDNLDDLQLGAIRRKIHTFFFDNELPTIDKVLDAVNTDDTLPDFKRTTFCKILQKLQVKYVKRSRNSALLDRDDIVRWRIKYLNKIVQLRAEGRKIYYTDETWLNEGHTMSKVWRDHTIISLKEAHREGLSMGLKNPSGKGKRLIILHIGSDTGFLEGGELIFEAKKTEGDYHSEMDSYNYEKWFARVLPILEPNSVVVIDNAPYHSRRKEKVPTLANKKIDLQKWLLEKYIPFDQSEVKAQLIEKIRKEKDKYQSYVIDEMAQENGITVVRLPPYHCELNPIELIWAQVKGYVARHNKSFKLNEIKMLLADAIKSVSVENWKRCIDHVIKEEQKMLKIDGIIDDVVDRFVINVGESDTSDSESESE